MYLQVCTISSILRIFSRIATHSRVDQVSNVSFLEEPCAFVDCDRKTSLAITHSSEDFVKPPQALDRPLFLGVMADGLEVVSFGRITWTLKSYDKSETQIIIDYLQ
jgi:hypothetical protein